MKKGFILLPVLIILVSGHVLLAQEFVRDFGTVTKEDLDYSQYPKEPDAEAVVLFDQGKSYFMEGNLQAFDLVFERHIRIKIFSEAGLRWAEQSIPFYRNGAQMEVVTQLEGYTYNLDNGQITKTLLDLKTTFEEKLDENMSLKKFAMPAVRQGSIVDIKYQVISPFVFRFNDWKFQSRIPTLYSFYEARLIPFYEYVYIMVGSPKLILNKSFLSQRKYHFGGIDYNDAIYQFAVKDVPSFSDEDFFASEDEFIQRIDFQLAKIRQADGSIREVLTTWPKLIATFSRDMEFGKYISKSEKSGKDVIIPNLSGKSDEEKTKLIVDFVKNNYSWTGYYGKFTRQSANDFMKQRSGSVADINLFLVGLLRAHGLEAHPVILSTRGNGRPLRSHPFDHFFNYVIAQVKIGDKTILADGTERHSQYDELPVRCLNDQGLVVKEGAEEWIELQKTTQGSETIHEISVNLSSQLDSIAFDIKNSAKGYEGMGLRSKSENNEEKLSKLVSREGVSIKKIETTNYSDPSQPYLIQYSGATKTEHIDSKLFVPPFLHIPPTANPFKSATRKHPVDLIYSRKSTYVSEITIPEGYVVEESPKNFKLENVLYKIEYVAEASESNKLKITGTFELKLSAYKPEHYAALKMASSKANDLFNQKIALIPVN